MITEVFYFAVTKEKKGQVYLEKYMEHIPYNLNEYLTETTFEDRLSLIKATFEEDLEDLLLLVVAGVLDITADDPTTGYYFQIINPKLFDYEEVEDTEYPKIGDLVVLDGIIEFEIEDTDPSYLVEKEYYACVGLYGCTLVRKKI